MTYLQEADILVWAPRLLKSKNHFSSFLFSVVLQQKFHSESNYFEIAYKTKMQTEERSNNEAKEEIVYKSVFNHLNM